MLQTLQDYGHKVRSLTLPKSPIPLHCMAISAGYEQRINEVYSWDGMQRGTAPFLVIQHTLVGEGRLDFAGTQHRLTPGQTMILSLPHAHRYWLERGQHWEYFWLVLNGREALRLAREIIDTAGPVVTLPPSIIDRMAAACHTLIDKPAMSPGEASSAAYSAMAALHDGVFGNDAAPDFTLPPAIARVVTYIDANLNRPLNVDRLARVAEMSRSHFVRQFTIATDRAPSAFVQEQRIERIERLLVATDMNVATIAALTGFSDPNYLAKTFRRLRGMTPVDYRAARRLPSSI